MAIFFTEKTKCPIFFNNKWFSLSLCVSAAIFFAFLTGCSKGSTPQFETPQKATPSADESQSAVNEQLAKEAGVLHLIYHVGPVDLPAHTTLDAVEDRPLVMKFQVDQPLWIVGFEPKVINAAGQELPSALLYQAIVSNMHEENPICSEGSVGNPFIVATSTLTKINLPDGYGYPVLPTDPLEAKVILLNPTGDNNIDVSFELNVVAKPMNEFTGMKDVKPMLVDLDPCTHKPLQVEPGQFSKRQATYTLPSSGSLIVAHSVLQNHASFVELYKKTEVMPFWRSEALLDSNHYITELTNNPFEDPAGVKFKKGDTITLGVGYDNAESSWLKDASAAAMVYFAPKEE